MDAVFYSVALNAIPHEEETEAIQEESSHKKAESSERTAQGLERNRLLSGSTACGGATMGEIRHARDARRQVHVCLAGGVESIPRPRSWAGCTCSHRDRRHGSVCWSETCSRIRPRRHAGQEAKSQAMKEQGLVECSYDALSAGTTTVSPSVCGQNIQDMPSWRD